MHGEEEEGKKTDPVSSFLPRQIGGNAKKSDFCGRPKNLPSRRSLPSL